MAYCRELLVTMRHTAYR